MYHIDSTGILNGVHQKGYFPTIDSIYCKSEKATINTNTSTVLDWSPASVIWADKGPYSKYPVVYYWGTKTYELNLIVSKGTISANGRVDIGISTGL